MTEEETIYLREYEAQLEWSAEEMRLMLTYDIYGLPRPEKIRGIEE